MAGKKAAEKAKGAGDAGLMEKLLNCMLAFIPVAFALELIHADPIFVFACSALGIIPLAGKMGEATEELGKHVGSQLGGILNATFGNLAELIIAIFAINAGLIDLVKASLSGSIIANLLFVVGLSFVFGGLKYKQQEFSLNLANLTTTMLLIAVLSMLIPSIIAAVPEYSSHANIHSISLSVAALLFLMYALSIVFSFMTHKEYFSSNEPGHEKPKWSVKYSIAVLAVSVVLLALLSEIFVGTVEHFAKSFTISEIFVGAVIVAMVGNAAEHFSSIFFTMKNKVDLAFNISVGSSIQVATFVVPVVVFYSFAIGRPMDIVFSIPELLALVISVLILNEVARDGKVNWFEGAQLVVMYLVIAAFFFFYT